MRGLLTGGISGAARPKGQARAIVLFLFAAGLLFSGCVGGQSGSEGFCGENERDPHTFTTETTDEDGGVEDEPDADTAFVADDDGPEAQNAPVQCATDSAEH